METKFTPGPWVLHLRDKTKTARVNGAGGIYITQRDFTSNTAADQKRIVADLQLIAAAPDLYAALQKAAAVLSGQAMTKQELVNALEAAQKALAKARWRK